MTRLLPAALAGLVVLSTATAALAQQQPYLIPPGVGGAPGSKGVVPGQNGFPAGPGPGPGVQRGGGFNGRDGGRGFDGGRRFGGGDRGGGYGGDGYRGGFRHRGYGDAVGAGVAGLAAGALIGGALANRGGYYDGGGYGYDDEGPTYAPVYAPSQAYVEDAPVVADPSYCARRYRSYERRSGTYLGYDGFRHPCP